MRNKIIASLVAGGVLVVAGFATAAVSSPSAASAEDSTDEQMMAKRGFDVLGDVLADLVENGVIDQSQADAITDAVQTRAEELRDEHEADRELLRGLLEDGVLTSEEAEQLPDDHFLLSERFDDAWSDGQLTRDELGFGHPFRRGFQRGFHFGKRFHGPDAPQSATENTSL